MNNTVKGYICGVIAAVSYGTNPLGALFLYEDGLRPTSVLFYRFAFGALILAAIMIAKHESFAINKHEGKVLAVLGLLFVASSLTYYYSFMYMAAGLASTILFFYPVMVAVIMALFFKEKLTPGTLLSIGLAMGGILLLYQGDGNSTLSLTGMMLVIISALAYAIYIVMLNHSHIRMSSVKLTFYALLVCVACIAISSLFDPAGGLQSLPTPRAWFYAVVLGLMPTVVSLVMMSVAVKYIGSTPTAIMGALEPLTAVVIGVMVFGEVLTPRLILGIQLILMAVIILVLAKQISRQRMLKLIPHRGYHHVRHRRTRRTDGPFAEHTKNRQCC
ncbi:putative membrane protein [Bacteroidales bacterium KA00344]|nr:putative membrane protein [Bacteroidales bacterium KA00344]